MKLYKVVTLGMRSLGLRGNPTILEYALGEWTESPDMVFGPMDWGGVWAASTYSGAKQLRKYMAERHGVNCRIFLAVPRFVLYRNSYRTKTDALKLIAELGC